METVLSFFRKHSRLYAVLFIVIITVPAFLRLLNNQYFSMHDDQHVARLFLLDQGIRQGQLFPRWVDMLGFGYGYPLFNFYPPLIYYVAELFHLVGFSFFMSIKLTFIVGFILAAVGVYLFGEKIGNKKTGFLASVLYTYFFYHSVNSYVRGALAEFFSMAVLPFVFLSIHHLATKQSIRNTLFFGLSLATLILTHPLIAVPFVLYLGFFSLFYFFVTTNKKNYIYGMIMGLLIGLMLSSFFWFPSMAERGYTMVNDILLTELANYKIHYIYPQQFIYSLWGYGGSIDGPIDGMTFQLGKIHIAFVVLAFILSVVILFRKKKSGFKTLRFFYFLIALLLFSLFMTTSYSGFIWDNAKYLWYLQFPWRFLTFAGFFMAVAGSYSVIFSEELLNKTKWGAALVTVFIIVSLGAPIIAYQKYFRPQNLLTVNDEQLTDYDEIAWRVSRTSFEFIPKGVATRKSEFNTTIPAIYKRTIPRQSYVVSDGKANVQEIKNTFAQKEFQVQSAKPFIFQLNTFYFPGWKAYVDGKETEIQDTNSLKLINVFLESGSHQLLFKFENTPVRSLANTVSLITAFGMFAYLLRILLHKIHIF